jgi:hypothetical protein
MKDLSNSVPLATPRRKLSLSFDTSVTPILDTFPANQTSFQTSSILQFSLCRRPFTSVSYRWTCVKAPGRTKKEGGYTKRYPLISGVNPSFPFHPDSYSSSSAFVPTTKIRTWTPTDHVLDQLVNMSSSPVVDRVDQATEAPLPVSHQPSPTPFEGQASMDTSWLDPTAQAALGFPFTPMSSTYNGGQSTQPRIPKATPQAQNDLKPLFTWSSQTFGQNAGNYRDYSQPTPSTASSLFYRQTPVSTESFLTAPSLTPLTGNGSDSSYTGVSPGFSYLGNDVNADGSITGSAPRRPTPIRHSSTNSVGTLSRPSPYGHSMSAWPYSYSGPGPVPPPMTNNFTLSQPPFSTRRPPTEPLPMYPPEQYQSTRRLHPSPGMRSAHSPFRSAHYSISAGRGGHHRHASLGQEAKPPRFKPTAEQKAILIETYETNP